MLRHGQPRCVEVACDLANRRPHQEVKCPPKQWVTTEPDKRDGRSDGQHDRELDAGDQPAIHVTMEGMLRFEANSRGSSGHHGDGSWWVEGFRAAGPIVMLVEDGSVWVMDQQGVRHALDAPGVVVWDTGDWVAYGSEGPAKIKDYWAPRASETGFHPCGPMGAPRGLPPS